MQAHELLKFLVELYPQFELYWDAESNLHRDGDEFTAHGLCSEFSSFFQDQALPLNGPVTESLYEMIKKIAAADPDDNDPVANALFTCFLENISYTQAVDMSLPYMGPISRRFFGYWHAGYRVEP
jgi:hypothetical protein